MQRNRKVTHTHEGEKAVNKHCLREGLDGGCSKDLSVKKWKLKNKKQKEILELRSTINEMRNLLEELNSVFKLTEERISELKGKSIEIMQSEDQREKVMKEKKLQRNVGHH